MSWFPSFSLSPPIRRRHSRTKLDVPRPSDGNADDRDDSNKNGSSRALGHGHGTYGPHPALNVDLQPVPPSPFSSPFPSPSPSPSPMPSPVPLLSAAERSDDTNHHSIASKSHDEKGTSPTTSPSSGGHHPIPMPFFIRYLASDVSLCIFLLVLTLVTAASIIPLLLIHVFVPDKAPKPLLPTASDPPKEASAEMDLDGQNAGVSAGLNEATSTNGSSPLAAAIEESVPVYITILQFVWLLGPSLGTLVTYLYYRWWLAHHLLPDDQQSVSSASSSVAGATQEKPVVPTPIRPSPALTSDRLSIPPSTPPLPSETSESISASPVVVSPSLPLLLSASPPAPASLDAPSAGSFLADSLLNAQSPSPQPSIEGAERSQSDESSTIGPGPPTQSRDAETVDDEEGEMGEGANESPPGAECGDAATILVRVEDEDGQQIDQDLKPTDSSIEKEAGETTRSGDESVPASGKAMLPLLKSGRLDRWSLHTPFSHVDSGVSMPFLLPFLGLSLPSLLEQTRHDDTSSKKRPWYERWGLSMVMATHLPRPSVRLSKWLFRTHYYCLQRLPPLVAFLIAVVVLPTIVPAVFAVSQYLIASLSGTQGWYDPEHLDLIYESFHLSRRVPAAVAILIGFIYELCVGVWWDIVPLSSADWGKGMGFAGASWIILACMEEIGWMGTLWPTTYFNHRIVRISKKIAEWIGSKKMEDTNRMQDEAVHDTRIAHAMETATSTSSSSSSSSAAPVTGSPSSPSHPHPHPRPHPSEWIHLTLSTFIVGLIWSAWHWPFILLKDYLPKGVGYVPGTVDTPLSFGFTMWIPRIIGTRFVQIYATLRSGSYWAAIIFHAAHNVMVFSYWARLPDYDPKRYPLARFMHAESGIPVVIMYVVAMIAIVMIGWRRHELKMMKRVHSKMEREVNVAAANKDASAASATSLDNRSAPVPLHQRMPSERESPMQMLLHAHAHSPKRRSSLTRRNSGVRHSH